MGGNVSGRAQREVRASHTQHTSLLRPTYLLTVGAGGMVGTAARFALSEAFSSQSYAVLIAVNIVGSLLLGVIVAGVHGSYPKLQLFLGTGLCGGFTTYSAFAVGTLQVAGGAVWIAACAALATIMMGVVAVAAGVWIGSSIRRGFSSGTARRETGE